jgi:ATP-dependent Zn protease
MEGDTSLWVKVLTSWAPVILIIGFWIFFMRKLGSGKQASYFERSGALLDRQVHLLERIAVALEQRNTHRD